MSYIGASPTTVAFPFDQFSGNGSTTAFTMSYAPASTTSMVVCISGVVQNPNTYSINGLTLTFSGAPPTGTNNIGVLYLGLPASGVTTPGNTAYLSSTQFTATAGQTTFTPSGTYQTGFVNVIRNGSQLAPSDYTATNGTTVVLANACVAGDVVVVEVYNLVSVSNALPLTGGTVTGATTFNSTVSINGANGSGYTGYKNRIINGGMAIDQRNNGASQTLGATYTYTVDRWFTYSFGANTTGQRVSSGITGIPYVYQITGAASVTNVQFMQRIEAKNISDCAGSTVTLSALVSNSLLTTINWTAYYANAEDNWTSFTQISSGNWTVNNTLTTYNAQISLPANAANGVWIIFTTGAQTSGTWKIGNVQLERGSNATSFEFRDYGRELMMCQRYYQTDYAFQQGSFGYYMAYYGGSNAVSPQYQTIVPMRAAPTVTISNSSVQYYSYANVWTNTTLTGGSYSNTNIFIYALTDGDGRGKLFRTGSSGTAPSPYYIFSSEL